MTPNMPSSGRADVLAVMDELALRVNPFGDTEEAADRYAEARAAVAELIEAANRMKDFADDEYVPNTVFAQLTQALARCEPQP